MELIQKEWCRDPDLHWGRQDFQSCALLPELSRQNRDENERPILPKPLQMSTLRRVPGMMGDGAGGCPLISF